MVQRGLTQTSFGNEMPDKRKEHCVDEPDNMTDKVSYFLDSLENSSSPVTLTFDSRYVGPNTRHDNAMNDQITSWRRTIEGSTSSVESTGCPVTPPNPNRETVMESLYDVSDEAILVKESKITQQKTEDFFLNDNFELSKQSYTNKLKYLSFDQQNRNKIFLSEVKSHPEAGCPKQKMCFECPLPGNKKLPTVGGKNVGGQQFSMRGASGEEGTSLPKAEKRLESCPYRPAAAPFYGETFPPEVYMDKALLKGLVPKHPAPRYQEVQIYGFTSQCRCGGSSVVPPPQVRRICKCHIPPPCPPPPQDSPFMAPKGVPNAPSTDRSTFPPPFQPPGSFPYTQSPTRMQIPSYELCPAPCALPLAETPPPPPLPVSPPQEEVSQSASQMQPPPSTHEIEAQPSPPPTSNLIPCPKDCPNVSESRTLEDPCPPDCAIEVISAQTSPKEIDSPVPSIAKAPMEHPPVEERQSIRPVPEDETPQPCKPLEGKPTCLDNLTEPPPCIICEKKSPSAKISVLSTMMSSVSPAKSPTSSQTRPLYSLPPMEGSPSKDTSPPFSPVPSKTQSLPKSPSPLPPKIPSFVPPMEPDPCTCYPQQPPPCLASCFPPCFSPPLSPPNLPRPQYAPPVAHSIEKCCQAMWDLLTGERRDGSPGGGGGGGGFGGGRMGGGGGRRMDRTPQTPDVPSLHVPNISHAPHKTTTSANNEDAFTMEPLSENPGLGLRSVAFERPEFSLHSGVRVTEKGSSMQGPAIFSNRGQSQSFQVPQKSSNALGKEGQTPAFHSQNIGFERTFQGNMNQLSNAQGETVSNIENPHGQLQQDGYQTDNAQGHGGMGSGRAQVPNASYQMGSASGQVAVGSSRMRPQDIAYQMESGQSPLCQAAMGASRLQPQAVSYQMESGPAAPCHAPMSNRIQPHNVSFPMDSGPAAPCAPVANRIQTQNVSYPMESGPASPCALMANRIQTQNVAFEMNQNEGSAIHAPPAPGRSRIQNVSFPMDPSQGSPCRREAGARIPVQNVGFQMNQNQGQPCSSPTSGGRTPLQNVDYQNMDCRARVQNVSFPMASNQAPLCRAMSPAGRTPVQNVSYQMGHNDTPPACAAPVSSARIQSQNVSYQMDRGPAVPCLSAMAGVRAQTQNVSYQADQKQGQTAAQNASVQSANFSTQGKTDSMTTDQMARGPYQGLCFARTDQSCARTQPMDGIEVSAPRRRVDLDYVSYDKPLVDTTSKQMDECQLACLAQFRRALQETDIGDDGSVATQDVPHEKNDQNLPLPFEVQNVRFSMPEYSSVPFSLQVMAYDPLTMASNLQREAASYARSNTADSAAYEQSSEVYQSKTNKDKFEDRSSLMEDRRRFPYQMQSVSYERQSSPSRDTESSSSRVASPTASSLLSRQGIRPRSDLPNIKSSSGERRLSTAYEAFDSVNAPYDAHARTKTTPQGFREKTSNPSTHASSMLESATSRLQYSSFPIQEVSYEMTPRTQAFQLQSTSFEKPFRSSVTNLTSGVPNETNLRNISVERPMISRVTGLPFRLENVSHEMERDFSSVSRGRSLKRGSESGSGSGDPVREMIRRASRPNITLNQTGEEEAVDQPRPSHALKLLYVGYDQPQPEVQEDTRSPLSVTPQSSITPQQRLTSVQRPSSRDKPTTAMLPPPMGSEEDRRSESPDRSKSPSRRSTTVTVTTLPSGRRSTSSTKRISRSTVRSVSSKPAPALMDEITSSKESTPVETRHVFSPPLDSFVHLERANPESPNRLSEADALLEDAEGELNRVEDMRKAGSLLGENAADEYARAAQALRLAALTSMAERDTLIKQLEEERDGRDAVDDPMENTDLSSTEEDGGQPPVLRVRVTLTSDEPPSENASNAEGASRNG